MTLLHTEWLSNDMLFSLKFLERKSLIVLGLFFGTIGTAQLTGNFQVLPAALKEGEIIPITEVKGYYSTHFILPYSANYSSS